MKETLVQHGFAPGLAGHRNLDYAEYEWLAALLEAVSREANSKSQEEQVRASAEVSAVPNRDPEAL